MATIEKRINSKGETSYRALVRIKGHPSVSNTFAQKTKAEEWAKRTEIAIKDGKYLPSVESNRRTVSELIDKYLKEEHPKKQNKNTDINAHLGIWKSLIGQYALIAIKPDILTSALHKIAEIPTPRGKTKSAATMNRYIASLSVVFSYGYKNLDWLSHNPMAKISKYSEPRGRVRYLTDTERENLLSACKESSNPILYPVVLLAITTGARKNEILSLKWADLDLHLESGKGRAILHETKNGEQRTLPIIEPALSVLRELESARGASEYLFPPNRFSSLTGHANINHAWYTAVEKAQIKNFRFHDLRHTTASYLAMNSITTALIADLLGHKSLQMTKRYSHLSDQHKQSVVERVMTNKIFGEAK